MINIQSLPRTPLALAIAAALAGNAAYAQSGDDSVTLAPVTVEASADASAAGLPPAFAGGQVARGARIGLLGNQSTLDTPFSTTAYTSQLIEDQQAAGVADVLRNDPTVRISRGFGNFQELYVIRGFPLFSDDMAYNGLYGVLPRQYVATEFLERVEVIRGTTTFVNGAAPGGSAGSGIGGSINLVPKRAPSQDLNRLTYGLQTGGQDYMAADISRRFGEQKELGLRVNAARRVGGTGIDDERNDFTMFSLGADYRGNGFRLSADMGMQDQKLTQGRVSLLEQNGAPLTSIPRPPGASKNYSQPWIYSGDETVFGTARAEFDLNDVTTTWVALGVREGKERNTLPFLNVRSDGSLFAFPGRFDNRRDETVVTGEAGIRTKVTTGAVQHQLTASAAGHWFTEKNIFGSPVFGAPDYSYNDNLYDSTPVPRPVMNDLGSPPTVRKTRNVSFALADTMGFFNESLLITLGGRLQKIVAAAYDGGESFDTSRWSPAVGAVYKLTSQTSVYANYAEALTLGSQAPFGTANAGQRVSPFVAKQVEAGVKYESRSFGIGLAAFSIERPSAYVDATNVFRKGGEQQHTGLELTLYGEPVRGVRVLGGATWIDAKLENKASVDDGNRYIGVPASQYNLGVEWDVPMLTGLSFDARAIYTGSQYFNVGNLASIPSWTRFDLGARYITRIAEKDVTFRARVDNISDRAYWSAAGGYPGASYITQGAPRIVMLSATVDF